MSSHSNRCCGWLIGVSFILAAMTGCSTIPAANANSDVQAPGPTVLASDALAEETAYPPPLGRQKPDPPVQVIGTPQDQVPAESVGDEAARPGIVARVSLVQEPDRILDFRHDSVSGRLFATTTDARLHVLDGTDFAIVERFSFGGELTIDEDGRRLYVMPGSQFVPDDRPIRIQVIDLDSLEVVGEIDDVHFVSVDAEHRRLFAGSPVRSYDDARGSDTIRVYDLDSLELEYEIEQRGIPSYNPYRDELLVASYTALVVDPVTGRVLEDLVPELAEHPFPWCNSCEYVRNIRVVKSADLAVLELSKVSTGGGPGFYPESIYLEAETLQEVTSFDRRLPFQPLCSTKRIPVPPVLDHIIWQQHYVRYIVLRNFVLHSLDGKVNNWRDGLFAAYINSRTAQAYTEHGYVLDLATLTPVGRLPSFCALGEDAARGHIYGRVEGDLLVVGENGGTQVAPVPTEPEPLPARRIEQILVSPDYATDSTIFLLLEDGRLYRSSDAGQTWARIQGGLPIHDYVTLTVSLSPEFGEDGTAFAGGFVQDYRGEGVLRSLDGGTTWQPLWNGLTHLRVYDVFLSPDFSIDGTVRALARFTRLSPWEKGVSLHESTDRGITWTQELTTTTESEMEEVLLERGIISVRDKIPIRVADYGSRLEVQVAGEPWQRAELEQKPSESILAVVPSPLQQEAGTYYVLGDYSLWRTTDSGQSWLRWRDLRLAGREYENALTALAVTPTLPDGSYRILIGTNAGEFWILVPPVQPTPKAETVDRPSGVEDDLEDVLSDSPPDSAATPESPAMPVPAESEPQDGQYVPGGALASVWESSPETRADLGWALTEVAESIPAAYQPFERGSMIWNGRSGTIVVLYDDGTWQSFEDTFEEGEAEFDPSLTPPGGAEQPIRGFGKLWRQTEAVQNRLGWALVEERGYTAFLHEFENGALLSTPSGIVTLIRDGDHNGRWR